MGNNERSMMIKFCCMLVVGLILLLDGGHVVYGQDYAGDGFDASSPEAASAAAKEMVPAMFIFGDSLIDNGNNNDLASLAKANYFPYGIDFNGGPTGRFSNGYTMVDAIGIYIIMLYYIQPLFIYSTYVYNILLKLTILYFCC